MLVWIGYGQQLMRTQVMWMLSIAFPAVTRGKPHRILGARMEGGHVCVSPCHWFIPLLQVIPKELAVPDDKLRKIGCLMAGVACFGSLAIWT